MEFLNTWLQGIIISVVIVMELNSSMNIIKIKVLFKSQRNQMLFVLNNLSW